MQKDLYLSLLQRLKVTHLHEGSSILTLCGTTARKWDGSWRPVPGCSQEWMGCQQQLCLAGDSP